MRLVKVSALIAVLLSLVGMLVLGRAAAQSPGVGEAPVLRQHVSEPEIERGSTRLKDLLELGEFIFTARFNRLDGQGRPAATGDASPTSRNPQSNPGFIRTSGPDASSCADCHNQPAIGGAGGFVANGFELAQVLNPTTESVSPEFSNERNTPGMNGSGAIEMLAREMTTDLIAIRSAAKLEAMSTGHNVTRFLDTKGVSFGRITARPNGTFNNSGIEGIDNDLIVRPFSQKGVVTSIRVFTVNSYNHHLGMQPVERFGAGQKDSSGNTITTNDFDGDGVPDELSVGDITAAVVFQAAMNVPGRVIPDDANRRAAAQRGQDRFAQIGCTDCHKPTLTLNSRFFTEPNPYNPPGNLAVQDVSQQFSFDLTKDIPKPRLQREGAGALVRAYTDLKRHVICDAQDPFFCNEQVVQNGVPVDQFITRRLWDVGSTAPYGHRGDLTTITDAIMHHAGEARSQRERFAALSVDQRGEIVEFLKQLQVLPTGSKREISESELKAMLNSQKTVQRVPRSVSR